MTIPAAAPMLLEAALRALVAAAILWTGLCLLRVRNVPAQKAAWGLVLAVALAMPLLMRVPLPAWAQVRVPAFVLPPTMLTAPAGRSVSSPAVAADFSSSNPATAPSSFASAGSPFDPASAPPASRSPRASAARPSAGVPEPAAELDPPLRVAAEGARGAAPVSAGAFRSLSATPMTSPVTSPFTSAATPVLPAPQAVRLYSIRGMSVASLSPLQWLWSLYLVVSAALLLRLALGVGSSLRLWMRARPVEISGHVSAIPVRASAHIASPVNIGSGIVLPAGFEAWDEEKLRIVLAHESSHVRQRDFYLQVFAGLYAALLWFSPLGWWLKRKLSELGEAISDRAALEAAPSPSDYAQLLLEFAALPHLPRTGIASTGVAMAHANNLSARIERLLNDTAFHQSFAGRRRAVAALLLAPIALLASTALVRVHAAENPRAAVLLQATPPQSDVTGQSHSSQDEQAPPPPQAEPVPAAPAAPAADAAPPTPPADAAPPAPPSRAGDAPVAPRAPEAPNSEDDQDAVAPWPAIVIPDINIPPIQLSAVKIPAINIPAIEIPAMPGMNGQLFVWDGGGVCDACALVGDPGTAPHFFGGSSDADDYNQEIEKARKQAHGHFFWFQKDDKNYIVDDPAIVSQIEAMVASMENLRHQMRDLAKQERGIGAQERAAAQDAREQARKQAATAQNIPKPDLTEALAQLNAAADSLKNAQGDTITRQQLAELQRKLSELQSKVIASETRVNLAALYNNADWTKYTQQMNEYGAQMGALGSQIGSKAKEEHSKIESIIDDSVKSGKAQPVN